MSGYPSPASSAMAMGPLWQQMRPSGLYVDSTGCLPSRNTLALRALQAPMYNNYAATNSMVMMNMAGVMPSSGYMPPQMNTWASNSSMLWNMGGGMPSNGYMPPQMNTWATNSSVVWNMGGGMPSNGYMPPQAYMPAYSQQFVQQPYMDPVAATQLAQQQQAAIQYQQAMYLQQMAFMQQQQQQAMTQQAFLQSLQPQPLATTAYLPPQPPQPQADPQLVAQLQIQQLQSQMNAATEGLLRQTLQNPEPIYRFVAIQTVGSRRIFCCEELIALLTDGDPQVQQAARQSLVQLSEAAHKESRDYGPKPGATPAEQKESSASWRLYWQTLGTPTDK
jgi:hypothetical protein